MLPIRRRSSFGAQPTALERQLVPIVSTLVASLLPILPLIADMPLLPPLGLMIFLGWRLLRVDVWPLWMGLPLGFFDDLASGQPIGAAMAGWTATLLVLDILDKRMTFRSHRQDWAIAAIALAGQITLGWALVRFSGNATPIWLMLPGLGIGALLWPITMRCCAALDRWRGAR